MTCIAFATSLSVRLGSTFVISAFPRCGIYHVEADMLEQPTSTACQRGSCLPRCYDESARESRRLDALNECLRKTSPSRLDSNELTSAVSSEASSTRPC